MILKKYISFYFRYISFLLLAANISTAQTNGFGVPMGQLPVQGTPKPPSIEFQSKQQQNIHIENNNLLIRKSVEQHNQQQAELQAINDKELFDNKHQQYLYEIRHYTAALNELVAMANGEEEYNFTKAAFLPENAFLDSQIKFEEYKRLIKEKVRLARLIMKREKLDTANELSKNYAIQKLFTTSISEKRKDGTWKTTKPMTYDFEDYRGDKNPTKTFSYKLLKTGKGQCYSMPVVAKAVANELKTRAYLSYAPEHVYIKFVDNNEQLYNFETTRGTNTTEQFITESGYVSSTAVKNRMYMDTLSTKQELSMFLFKLANGFTQKFGYSDFVLECTDQALRLDSTNIHALMLRSDYYTLAFNRGLKFYKIKNDGELNMHPDLVQYKQLRDQQYGKIDQSGYQPMPAEAYERWLNALNSEKMKEQNKEFQKSIQQQLQYLKK